MRPVFKDRFIEAMRARQVAALVIGNARIEDMVVASLDHVDGVDLHVAQMRDGRLNSFRPAAERRFDIEPLRLQPESPRLDAGDLDACGHADCVSFN